MKPKETLKIPPGAIPDPMRCVWARVSTETHYALRMERTRRREELKRKGMLKGNKRETSMSVIVEDALIQYLGVGSEEE